MNVDAGLEAVAKGSKSFSNSFLKALVESNPDNLVCSSLSAQALLAMAAYGARGKIATEMRSALHLPKDDKLGLSGYQSLIKALNNEHEVVLRLANAMFMASDVAAKPSYKELTATKFMSPIKSLDFTDSSATAEAINTWCAAQTDNRVTKVVKPGDFQPDTVFVLMNAVYFKGQWLNQFRQYATSDQTFHVDETTTKLVPTMSHFFRFQMGVLPALDARLLELPYKGETLSMIIILPNSIAGLNKLLDNLDQVNLKQSLKDLKSELVDIKLPKFKFECNFDLQPTLAKLGMKTMFETATDFSGIADVPINITKAVQTAFIEVNESGTEAYAISRVMGGGCGPVEYLSFIVDRPFYFTIIHHQTGISLFNGIVKDPSLQ